MCQVGGKKTQAPGSQGHQDPGGELQVGMTVRGVQGDLSPFCALQNLLQDTAFYHVFN